MRKNRDIIFFGAFTLLILVLLAGFAGIARTGTDNEPKETCLPNTPCSAKPVQDYHWNPVSRGLMHI